jgi:hypothetical protein
MSNDKTKEELKRIGERILDETLTPEEKAMTSKVGREEVAVQVSVGFLRKFIDAFKSFFGIR